MMYISGVVMFRYERERLPRVRTVYIKGKSAASAEDKEEYLYKPTFKPLWRRKASSEQLDFAAMLVRCAAVWPDC